MYLELITTDISGPNWQRDRGRISGCKAAGCAALMVLAALLTPHMQAQQQFEDLAAQAAAARDQQNIPAAIDLYKRAVEARPDWQEGWWYLTLLQYTTNQYPGAIDAASHLLQLEPHAVPAIALRGLSEFEVADYKGSLRDLDMAVQHGAANDPHNEQIVRYHLALDLTRAGRFQDALEQYRALAAKQIDAPEILVGIGLAGMRVTSFPSEVRAEDQELYTAAGRAGYAFLTGESNQADELFRQMFAKYPTTQNLHQFYGMLLYSHDPQLAAEQFSSEVAVAPANLDARALLAFTLVLSGKYAEALPEAQKVYAAEPGLQMAQLALGRSLGETGDIEQGTALLKKVLEQDPNNLEAHLGLASLFARAGKRGDAYRERMVCLKLAQ
ncbi:tetratricopeptide repeat protein [Occallatibacter riparius]|uniref:Tetratricopeptide repeat protein n=1 Tax=Occallatibacter riparius TaxID=1002689 RepID=A0A9J7BSF5_9BACT|nr:tetratricopeptide repeat protein [Occallatibacter riparius]UWZ85592.1 tetratricopeptide repeat protein [Occallatibacter riparius]